MSAVPHSPPATTPLEPSFQDLIAAVEEAGELSDQRRRHWVCSLRQIAMQATEQFGKLIRQQAKFDPVGDR